MHLYKGRPNFLLLPYMNQRQAGLVSPLVVATIVLSVLVVGLGGFSFWAYTQYQSYKNDVDPKIAAAVTTAKETQRKEDQKHFDEQEKLPTRQLVGPDDLGRVSVNYPKTWSVYIEKNGQDGQFEAYLFPGAVPGVATKTPYALRVTIQDETYERSVADFESQIKAGKLKATPVKIGKAAGTRLDGTFVNDIKGSMVLFKVRDKTLKVYTQSDSFKNDYDKIVLPSLKFNR
jgi:hypothetical protein